MTTSDAYDPWPERPRFALDADVTVYWPDVRPCWEQRGPSVRLFCPDCPAEHQDEHLPDCEAPDSLLPAMVGNGDPHAATQRDKAARPVEASAPCDPA